MKKFISLLVILVLICLTSISSFAAEPNQDTVSKSAEVSYMTNATYTVTIPAYIVPSEKAETSMTYSVAVSDIVVEYGSELNTTISYDGVMKDNKGAELEYALYLENEKIKDGDILMSEASGITDGHSSVSFYGLCDKVKYAGSYSDTITFDFTVQQHTYTREEIDSCEYLIPIGKNDPYYVVAAFNEDYSDVIIFKNGEDSDGLMKDFMTPAQFSSSEDPHQAWVDSGKASPMLLNTDTLTNATVREGVVSLGERAFAECSNITNITFPQSLTTLSQYTFYNCSSLTEAIFTGDIQSVPYACFTGCRSLVTAVIPDTATEIAGQAFYNCVKLEHFNMPKSVKNIGTYAFYGSKITYFDLPEGLETIQREAFRDCSKLQTITIPSTTTFIGEGVFRNNESLTKVDVNAENKCYTSVEGVLYSIDSTLLLAYPAAKEGTEYTILPATERIGVAAFNKSILTTVILPDSLLEIGNRAFESSSSLLELNIPKNVYKIEEEPVYFCVDLERVTVDENNTNFKVHNEALYSYDGETLYFFPAANDKITHFEILPTTKTIMKSALYNAKFVEEITIPEGVKEIPSYAFASSGITTVNLPNSLTSIDTHAFFNCNHLEKIIIPSSVTNINTNAFYQCTTFKIIYGVVGSYAETWATDNGYTFVAI